MPFLNDEFSSYPILSYIFSGTANLDGRHSSITSGKDMRRTGGWTARVRQTKQAGLPINVHSYLDKNFPLFNELHKSTQAASTS